MRRIEFDQPVAGADFNSELRAAGHRLQHQAHAPQRMNRQGQNSQGQEHGSSTAYWQWALRMDHTTRILRHRGGCLNFGQLDEQTVRPAQREIPEIASTMRTTTVEESQRPLWVGSRLRMTFESTGNYRWENCQ